MANTICWFDLAVENLDRAKDFYSVILNKKLEVVSEHGFSFVVFPHDDESNDVAGCLYKSAEFKPNNSDLMIYFDVNGRIKEAAHLVEQHGGKIVSPVESIGPYGFRAVIIDSEGNKVALYSKTDH